MEINSILIFAIATFLLLMFLLLLVFMPRNRITWKENLRKEVKILKQQATIKTVANYQTLLMQSDKLLDHCFKSLRLDGESMGERLKSAKHLFDRNQYNQIWEAHKERNKLVHEVSYDSDFKLLEKHVYTLLKAIEKLLK